MILPAVRVAHPHITVSPEVHAGSPTIRGTHVPVRRLWSWFSRGVSVETLVKRYPTLGPAKVFDALAFAFDNRELIEADLAREAALLGPEPAVPTQIQLVLPEKYR